ncbi:MAG: DASS family sodium-coupled anion symporter [Candidatus Heimdallarchaeota archaeon]|nr:DASS family sodium-coupled anion symporter [Candidatus Heimdallarchaeota archaeon]
MMVGKFRKLILFALCCSLFILGYNLAPDPLPDGNYTVSIRYESNQIQFNINIDSDIDSYSIEREINVTHEVTTLSVTYYELYSGKVSKEIIFNAQIYQNDTKLTNPQIGNFLAQIIGQGQIIDFPPSDITNGVVEFKFRILKHSNIALGLLFAISFLWLTELIPMAATSLLIPIAIVLTGIDSSTGALSEFSNPTVFLFLGGFLLAIAFHRSGLDEKIAIHMISIVPADSRVILATFMGLAAVFSMFISNTAACALLIPLALQLLNNAGIRDEKYKKTVILGIAYAATVGGIGTLIGTPPNIIAASLIESYNPDIEINFLTWSKFGMPIVILLLPIIFMNLWWRFKPDLNEELLQLAKQTCKEKIAQEGMYTKNQITVAIIFLSTLTLWLTSTFHNIPTSIVALMSAVSLYVTGQLKQDDMNEINWNTLITFGGGLTLGTVIIRTGLADWLALEFGQLRGLPEILIYLIIGTFAILLTQIASNTASASILVPIVMPLSIILGINPLISAIMVAIICSMDFAIVIGSPPVLLAYSTGYFKVKEIFKIGILIDLIGLLTTVFLTYFVFGLLI